MLLDQSVCVAGGEMLVIEDPDLHISPARLVQHNVHIMPPAGAAEVLMRPGLYTHSTDPTRSDFTDLFTDHFLGLTAHP